MGRRRQWLYANASLFALLVLFACSPRSASPAANTPSPDTKIDEPRQAKTQDDDFDMAEFMDQPGERSPGSPTPARSPTVKTLNGAVIRMVMREAMWNFQDCHDQFSDIDPTQIRLRFTVTSRGTAETTDVVKSDAVSTDHADCLRSVLAELTFPIPEDGHSLDVVYPISYDIVDSRQH